ncbi:hypothetical protein Q9966_015097 [Columba livia]|nr:hypothetical protein Q9233_013864 [Columba guinea]KAK2516335.1 hypothetical protein Q9966_015097 [Columba livia]
MKQQIMADGPRCKRRKQANPRRKNGKTHTVDAPLAEPLTRRSFECLRGYLFPMVQNRLDITVHQFQGFPWRYLHQISPVKLQVEIGRPEN